MKKRLIFLIVLFQLKQALPQSTMQSGVAFMNVGNVDLQCSFFWQPFSRFGHALSYKATDSWDIWDNPASLVAFNDPYFSLSFQPQVGVEPTSYYDVDSAVRSRVNYTIRNYRLPYTRVQYPRLALQLGQEGGIYGFQAAYPLRTGNRYTVVSLEIGQPFWLDLHGSSTGFSALLEATNGDVNPNDDIHLNVDGHLQVDFQAAATNYKVGFSQQLSDKAAIGFRLSQLNLYTYIDGYALLNGAIGTVGMSSAFNDPNDPRINFANGETNRLDQSLYMKFRGSGWQFNTGMLYRPTPSLTFGLDLGLNTPAVLKGQMNVTQHVIPALNADAFFSDDPTAELIDGSKLDLMRLTLTKKVDNPTSNRLIISFPSSLGFQASYQGRLFESTVSLRKYAGYFGYDFLHERRGIKLHYSTTLDVSLSMFTLSLGGMRGEVFCDKEGRKEKMMELWIPSASFELAFFIANRYQVSNKLFFAPTPGFGSKLGYFF